MMPILELLLALVAAWAAFWAIYVVVLPLLARFRPALGIDDARADRNGSPCIAVIIPAHNVEDDIARCIQSLRACDYPKDTVEIYVIADHCSDNTSQCAADLGVSPLIREDGRPGKSYAIAWCLEQLEDRKVNADLYVVVDATVEVGSRFLAALATAWRHGEDIVVGHASVDPSKQQWFIRCMGLTLAHRRIQNQAREHLGLSSLIEGRGMAYSREYIGRFGWTLAVPDESVGGVHPTEDWRHGVRVVANGFRVAFADQARIYTPLRGTLNAATKQGLRWERGRVGNAMTHGIDLLKQGLRDRSRIKIWAALDSIQPPVAILSGLCFAAAVGGLALYGLSVPAALIALPTGIVGCYALVVVERGRRDGIALWTVLWAPVYLLWRCVVFGASLIRLDRRERVVKRAPSCDR